MSDQNFDDILKNKLEAHASDSMPSWDKMKEKMSRQEDAHFDALLFDKISSAYNNDEKAGWSGFDIRYTHFTYLKKQIQSVKLVESVCMLLLLLIFNSTDLSFLDKGVQAVSLNPVKTSQLNDVSEIKTVSLEINSVGSPTLVNEAITEKSNEISLGITSQKSSQQKSVRSSYAASIIPSELNKADTKPSELSDQVKEQPASKALTIYNDDILSISYVSEIDAINPFIRISRSIPSLRSDYSFSSQSIKVANDFRTKTVSFFAAFDNNTIHTPNDLAYNTSARTTEMYGYSLGVLFGNKRGKTEWEIGMAYSAFDKPWDFTLQYGNSSGWYSFVMTNIHYDILSIPVNFKYHVVENDEWSIFLQAGASAEAIVQSEFTTRNQYLGGGALPPGQTPSNPEDAISPFELERNFNQGLFEGGRINDSAFIRAQIGAGIQRKISDRLYLSFSGVYGKHVINREIGPNNDRMDRFSIMFALKQNIN